MKIWEPIASGVLILTWLLSLPTIIVSAEPQDLAGRMKQAQAAMESGNYEKAISLYRELIEVLPDMSGLHMNVGIAYYMTGDHAQAVSHLERVLPELGRQETFFPALLFLGASYLELDKHEQALKHLMAYVEERPKDPEARRLLGDTLLSLGRHQDAAEQFEILARLQSSMPEGWDGLRKSYEAIAAKSFEQVEAGAPESAYWFALMGDARLSEQQYQSAFFFYKKALERNPEIRGLHAALSRIYEVTGHPEWAEIEKKRETNLGELDCPSQPLLCHFAAGRFREILQATRSRHSPEALYWRAQASISLAAEALDRLEQLPPSFELHRWKAETHEKQGRSLQALQEWERAVELDPGNPVAKRGLAIALYRNREYSRAGMLIEELLEVDPHSSELNYYAGLVLLDQGESEEAVPFLQKALQGKASFAAAHASLGRAYVNLGKMNQALPHLQSALEADSDGSAHYLLGQVYRSRGEQPQAQKIIEEYRKIQEREQAALNELDEKVQITPP